jgi:hypothetical protein
MVSTVYFGNATTQQWIKAPSTGLNASPVGWSSTQQLLDGRAFVKRSRASHREFNMNWLGSLNSTEASLQTIKDYHDGVYGDGPFYWVDPYAMATNVLPPQWAAPGIAEKDWSKLTDSVTPSFATVSYANGYPVKSATYTFTSPGDYTDKALTIIIPPGYTFHFGWHSTSAGVTAATATGIRITRTVRSTGATSSVDAVSLLAGGTTRTNTTFNGDTYSKVTIYPRRVSGSLSPTMVVVGMIGQLLPNGTSVASGGFLAGRGTTALEFGNPPTIEYYSAAINSGQVGMSTKFIEV